MRILLILFSLIRGLVIGFIIGSIWNRIERLEHVSYENSNTCKHLRGKVSDLNDSVEDIKTKLPKPRRKKTPV